MQPIHRVFIVAAFLLCFATGPAIAADWDKFGGPNGDFTSPETGLLLQWPAKGPKVLWTMPIGEGYCQPTIAAGRLYLFDRTGDEQRLQCLDIETREKHWEFRYPTDFEDMYGYDGGPRACPVVDGDRVYLLGPEGMLHCLGTADGKVVWKKNIMQEFGVVPNFFGVGAAPVVEQDKLILQVGGSPPNSPGVQSGRTKGNGTGIVAFDKLTGEVKYTITDELASYSVPALATIDGRRWCFVFARGGLVGFDPSNGKVDFHFPWRARIVESVNASNPVVIGDKVFISECYGQGCALLKVKPGGFEVLWQDEGRLGEQRLATHMMTPVHIDGYLYGSSGRHAGGAELRCIEVATGKVMWSTENVTAASAPGYKGPIDVRLTRVSLTHVDGHLIALGEMGQLVLIKPDPMRLNVVAAVVPADEKDEEVIPNPAWAAPVISGGRMYIRAHKRLICMQIMESR